MTCSRDPNPAPPCQTTVILLVEDNKVFADVACLALERQFPDCRILKASTIAEARTVAGCTKLDVVVTDLSLPDGSGADLARHLEPSVRNGLKLVAFTNSSQDEVLHAVTERGFHGFVGKEHGIRALGDAIRAVLRGARYVSPQSA